MRRFLTLVSLGGVLATAACAYPVTKVEQGAAASTLYIVAPPAGAQLVVDGAAAGLASTFDGRPNVLSVAPGSHTIEIVDGGTTVLRRAVYVGVGAQLPVRMP